MQPYFLLIIRFNLKLQVILLFVYILAIDDSIRVEHGDDFKNVALSQTLCFRSAAHKEFQSALHHPAGVGLTGMYPGRQKHHWTTPYTQTLGCSRIYSIKNDTTT